MGKKILVIDDDKDILEPILLLLEEEGYVVITFQNVEHNYKKIEELKPDLILLDMLISGSDGRIICKDLKKNAKLKNVPVVMMSAHHYAAKDAKVCGADGFLAKPFETFDLINTVKKYIKK